MAIAAPIVAVVIIGGAWYLNASGIANATTLLRALEPSNPTGGTSDPMINLADFQKVLAGAPLGRQEATEQLLQAAISVNGSQVSPTDKQAYYTAALAAITEMTKERPHDARLELFFGSFLNQYGQSAQALQELQMAHADSPAKQQIDFELGVDTLLRSGDVKDALPILKAAYEEEPSYDQARTYYAVALYASGDIAGGDQLLLARYGTVNVDDPLLVNVFEATKQYARAEAILQARVTKNPTDAQSYVQLAGVYYMAGDKASAVATLKAAAAANPGYAAQINQLIVQVEQGKVTP